MPLGVNAPEIQGVSAAKIYRAPDLTEVCDDWLAEEVAVALSYNGISHVVMMATPTELEAFALGFSLSEGIIDRPKDIFGIEIVPQCQGIEVQIELSSRCFMRLKERRRNLVGRTGCGICGVEQLEQISQKLAELSFNVTFPLNSLEIALANMAAYQPIGTLCGATHAALWLAPDGTVLGAAEDVGRHVALDKLLGLRAKAGWQEGAILISSRASYEMVQKAVACGVEILFALSAATALAATVADEHGLTLAGFCRQNKATVYSHPERLLAPMSEANPSR